MRYIHAIILVMTLAVRWAPAGQSSLQPLHSGRYDSIGLALGVAATGNIAYLADGQGGLQVIDVSDPANPVRVGGSSVWAQGVAVSENWAYVVGQGPGDESLMVIDVSNPTNCVRVGGIVTAGEACAVAVAGNYAYVADNENLAVIDVSNPTYCVQVGGYGGFYTGVAVSGKYAYVSSRSNGSRGLKVFDVGNATNCLFVGEYLTSEPALGVTVAGHYAYLANGETGLHVIDINDPAHCVRVGGYNTPGFAHRVAVSRDLAYVADDTAGLHVIDVSNPTNCVSVGAYDTGGFAYDVAVVAGKIYVADGEAGLLVLPTVPNVQFTVRTYATPGVPFTIEAATNLTHPVAWSPLLTTNVPTMPFDYVDFDVKLSNRAGKYYRVVVSK